MIMIYLLHILFNFLVLFFFKSIKNKINLFDKPDSVRKFHSNQVACIGGLIVFSNILFFTILDYFFINKIFDYNLIIFCFIFFMIGYFDDKYILKTRLKILIFLSSILLFLIIDNQIILNELRFSFGIFLVENYFISLILTALCLFLFINAYNMLDGINLLSGIYAAFIFLIFIFHDVFINLSIIVLLSLITFLILNYRNQCFLGDNGTLLLSFLIGFIFLKVETTKKLFYADEILLIMLIPGLELIRLFITRIAKNQNPLMPDRCHLHHILLNKFSQNMATCIILALIIFPYLFAQFYQKYFIIIFLISIIYFWIVIKFSFKKL